MGMHNSKLDDATVAFVVNDGLTSHRTSKLCDNAITLIKKHIYASTSVVQKNSRQFRQNECVSKEPKKIPVSEVDNITVFTINNISIIEKISHALSASNKQEKYAVYELAFRDNVRSIQYIQDPSLEMVLTAVKYDGLLLQRIKHQSFNICLVALQCDGMALQYVDWKLFESSIMMMMFLCKVALMCDGMAIQFLPDKIKKHLNINQTSETVNIYSTFYSTFYH